MKKMEKREKRERTLDQNAHGCPLVENFLVKRIKWRLNLSLGRTCGLTILRKIAFIIDLLYSRGKDANLNIRLQENQCVNIYFHCSKLGSNC